MATILFWNLNKKYLIDALVWLCDRYEVDILILAESEISPPNLQIALNSEREQLYFTPTTLSTHLSFFCRYSLNSIQPIAEEGRVSIQRIVPPIGRDFLLVSAHLPSKLHRNEPSQLLNSVRIAQMIQEAENQVGHRRTLVIGDLNMNPFEDGIIAADGFHAVMTQQIARKRDRTVQGQRKPFFYNPIWGRMGDLSPGAPGTYYHSSSDYINYFWNTFDQVLLRPDLLDYFLPDGFQIISQIGENNLLTESGKISSSFSDHLPIMVKIEIERLSQNG